MKSLTEQQLRDLLKKAWEDGAATFDIGFLDESPYEPRHGTLLERDELINKLIASV